MGWRLVTHVVEAAATRSTCGTTPTPRRPRHLLDVEDFRKHFNRIDVLFRAAYSPPPEDALGEWRGQTAERVARRVALEPAVRPRGERAMPRHPGQLAARHAQGGARRGVGITYKRASLQVLRMKKDAGWGPALTSRNYCVVERTAFWNKRDVALELEMGADCDGHAAGAAESRPPSAGSSVRAARACTSSHIVMPSCWDAGGENDYIISMRHAARGRHPERRGRRVRRRPLDWAERTPRGARRGIVVQVGVYGGRAPSRERFVEPQHGERRRTPRCSRPCRRTGEEG